jgi:hypothetical protein
MGNRYGIVQKANAFCVLYKEDTTGSQSYFTVLNPTKKESDGQGNIIVFIDNEDESIANAFHDHITSSKKLLEIFDDWAYDAPVVFQMEAYSSLLSCCFLKKSDMAVS